MPQDKPAILLTGRPGIGKTTAIHKIVSLLGGEAGGFYTREVLIGGRRAGFELATLTGERDWLASKEPGVAFAHQTPFKSYKINLDAINLLGVPALLRAMEEGKVVIVDEIGPMEMLSPLFRQTIIKMLDSEAVVVGSVYQRPNPFADRVKAHPRVTVKEITLENRDRLPAEVAGMLAWSDIEKRT